jgi:hypothetical protein
MSSVLLGGPPPASSGASPAASALAPLPPASPRSSDASQRNSALTVIAGVGVLLLAMGVGVLIGRSGAGKQSVAPASVITVGSTPTTGAAGAAAGEQTFASDWPSGTTGFTVQLQTLAQPGTSVSAVQAAKSAATAKGATGVGALSSQEYTSLTGGSYVIYSGVDHSRAQAEKALAGLRTSFPNAKVIAVSNSGAGSSAGGSRSSSSSKVGSSVTHPAPPTVLNKLKSAKGKSYEEQSKALPNVVETG